MSDDEQNLPAAAIEAEPPNDLAADCEPSAHAPELVPAPEPEPEPAPTAGQLLRSLREQAGVDLERLAAALKVNVQKLRWLEEDNFAALPAQFMARGLAGSVCRHLGVSAAPVLALMPDERPRIANDDEMQYPAFVSRSAMPSVAQGNGSKRMLWWAMALVLLVAATALFVWPSLSALWHARASAPAPAQQASGAGQPVAAEHAIMPPGVAQEIVAPSQEPPAVAVPPAPQPSEGLVFVATGESWVQVKNAAGRSLFEQVLQAGDMRRVDVGQYPVVVVVGKAGNVQLTRDGASVALLPQASSGVVRVELR